MSTERDIGSIKALIFGGAVSEALSVLNSGVPHRYTALYQLKGSNLQNVALHDKAGEVRPEFLAVVPFESSFCQFVIRDGQFRTSDSSQDARLDGHPYQGVMVEYHGVPIVVDGEVWGTICHFDVTTHMLSDAEFSLLQETADAMALRVWRNSL